MTDQEVIDLINLTLIEEFELNMKDMKPEALIFDDLELDSLDIVDMVVVLENTFQFKIREESSIRKIRSLGDIHEFVINKKNQLAGS